MLTSLLFSAILTTPAVNYSGKVLLGKSPAKGAVIFLEGYGKPKPVEEIIEQKNRKFIPRILVVPVGSKVSFPNRDTVYHNVFAEYNAKKFDLGMYPKGESRSQVFDKPGIVSILCNIHSDMSAYIVVVDSAAYALANDKGNFVLNNVEPGTYKMQIWHESGAKLAQPVTVSASNSKGSFAIKKK